MSDRKIVATVGVAVRPDARGFSADLRRQIDEQVDDVKVPVKAETAEANAKLDETERKARELDGKTVRVRVKEEQQGFGPLALLAGLTPALGTAVPVVAGFGAGLAGALSGAVAGAAAFGLTAKAAAGQAISATSELARAQGALNTARENAAKTPTAANLQKEAKALQDYQAALVAVTPQEKAFTDAQSKLGIATTRNAESILPTLTNAVNVAVPFASQLVPIATSIAPAVDGLINRIGKFAGSAEFGQFLAFIKTEGPKDVAGLGNALLTSGSIGIRVFERLGPLTQLVLGDLNRGLTHLNDNLARGGLSGLTAAFQRDLPLVEHVAGDVGRALIGLSHDLAPLGPVILKDVDAVAGVLQEARPTVQAFVDVAVPGLNALAATVRALGPVLGPIAGDIAVFAGSLKLLNTVPGVNVSAGGILGLLGGKGGAKAAAAEAETAAAKTGLFSRALGGLSNAASGGNIALAGLAVGLVGFQANAALARKEANDTATAIANINSKVSLNDQAGYLGAAGKLSGVADAFRNYGGGIVKNTPTVRSLDAAASADVAAAQRIGNTLDDVSRSTGRTQGALLGLANSAGVDLSDSLNDVNGELTVLTKFGDKTPAQLQLIAAGLDNIRPGANNAADDVGRLNSLFGAYDLKVGSTQATDRFSASLRAAQKQLKSNHDGLSANTEGAEANRAAVESAAQALKDQVTAARAAGEPLDKVQQLYATGYEKVKALANSTGDASTATTLLKEILPSDKEFEAYIKQIEGATHALALLAAQQVIVHNHQLDGILNGTGPSGSGTAPKNSDPLTDPLGGGPIDPHKSGGTAGGILGLLGIRSRAVIPSSARFAPALPIGASDPNASVVAAIDRQTATVVQQVPVATGAAVGGVLNGTARAASQRARAIRGS